MMSRWKLTVVFLCTLCLSVVAWGETKTVLILHTNDLHDHIRPNYDGIGGLPYVAGHIRQMRDSRKDLLLLDAGDVTEKGDMVAFATKSGLMYEAMEKIGYTAATAGNHDFSLGIPELRQRLAKAPHVAWLCANYADTPDVPSPTFLPSKIVDIQGLKIGIVGLTLPKDTKETLDMKGTAKVLADEVSRLREQAHLLVVLGHLNSRDCARLSAAVPQVQIFVGGHSHELLRQPIVAAKTGALIVQAGDFARFVGHLDLVVDTETKKVVQCKGSVVELRHDQAPCDTAMLEWERSREREVCPQATKIVGRAEKVLGQGAAARLALEGMRLCGAKSDMRAEIAVCNPQVIMRSGLPKGELDENALFRTGGQRGNVLIAATLTGGQIERYLKDAIGKKGTKPLWSGFEGQIAEGGDTQWIVKTDLDKQRAYRVVMPELEWTSVGKRIAKENGAAAPAVTRCPFTFTDAFAAYAEELTARGKPLDKAEVLHGLNGQAR
jgi:5'-nucleotidase